MAPNGKPAAGDGPEDRRHDVAKKGLVYRAPGVDAVTVRRDVEYHATEAGALTMDVYYPPGAAGAAPLPAVVFVFGYSDLGVQAFLGCKSKEMESYISWARLAAASGMAAIAYETSREPAADVGALLQYARQHAAQLNLDASRIGVWSCSGHVPNALSLLMQPDRDYLRCARNLPVTLLNHAEAPHAFDLMHDSETSRQIIRDILAFLKFHLLGQS
jgi:hypothetical protein